MTKEDKQIIDRAVKENWRMGDRSRLKRLLEKNLKLYRENVELERKLEQTEKDLADLKEKYNRVDIIGYDALKNLTEAKERIRALLFHITNDTFYVTFETREQSVEKARQFLLGMRKGTNMNETKRMQIKGALLKCAKENENKITPTCYVIVSEVCRAAAERISELEEENNRLLDVISNYEVKVADIKKENAELKEQNRNYEQLIDNGLVTLAKERLKNYKQLIEAKDIIKDYMIVAKGGNITVCSVPEENRCINVLKLNKQAEQFLEK